MSESTGGLSTLGINFPIFIAQLVNFLIVLLVMWKFAYKPIVKILDDRSKKIETSIQQAEEIERRVSELEAEREEVMGQAKQEATQILEMARIDVETKKIEQLATTKKEVERVVAQGKEQLKAEKANMIREAKMELIELAIGTAKKILEETIDEKKSHQLAERAIKHVQSYEGES